MTPCESRACWRVCRDFERQPFHLRPLVFGLLSFAAIAIGISYFAFGRASAPSWQRVRQQIARRFPGVESIGTQALADWLADSRRPPPLLFDVRTREEYEVSHLPGAIWAETAQQQSDALMHVPLDRALVLYCSVGWRSAQAAARMLKEGRRGVLNLDGSIFQWANEGRPLVDGRARQVRVVHPFNQTWGSLLDRHLWSHTPPA